MKRYFLTAITALAITAAVPMLDSQIEAVQLNAGAHADWEDIDEARRAARRTARRVSNRNDNGAGQPINVLPNGCYTQVVSGVAYQNCGGVYYQTIPGQTTYVIVQPPVVVSTLPVGCITKQLGGSTFFECGSQVYKSAVINGQSVYQLQ
jgi:hypothetical protein